MFGCPPSVGDAPLALCSRSGEGDLTPLVDEAREMASGPQSACRCRVGTPQRSVFGTAAAVAESEQLMIVAETFSFSLSSGWEWRGRSGFF